MNAWEINVTSTSLMIVTFYLAQKSSFGQKQQIHFQTGAGTDRLNLCTIRFQKSFQTLKRNFPDFSPNLINFRLYSTNRIIGPSLLGADIFSYAVRAIFGKSTVNQKGPLATPVPLLDLGDATNFTLFSASTDLKTRRPRFDFDEMCLFSKQQRNVLSVALFESKTAQVFFVQNCSTLICHLEVQ